jgi:hypothetical protein
MIKIFSYICISELIISLFGIIKTMFSRLKMTNFIFENIVKSLHVKKFFTFTYGMRAVLTLALEDNFSIERF